MKTSFSEEVCLLKPRVKRRAVIIRVRAGSGFCQRRFRPGARMNFRSTGGTPLVSALGGFATAGPPGPVFLLFR